METKTTRSIIASATVSNKNKNEDSAKSYYGNSIHSITIADGIGSYAYADIASASITETLHQKAVELDQTAIDGVLCKDIDLVQYYRQAKMTLLDIAASRSLLDNTIGSTAISVFETNDKMQFGYVGNGAIWHIRGNFNELPASIVPPWNMVNFLNPHSVYENGREAIYKSLSNNTHFDESIPSILSIDKDKQYGDIVMICTDGIYSADKAYTGRNQAGIWIRHEHAMIQFIKQLREYMSVNKYSNDSLEKMLEKYLEHLQPSLNDDATVGVVITAHAIDYQKNCCTINENNKHRQL